MSRSVNDISFNTKLSYVQIRNCIKTHFPQCFEENNFGGWDFTGEALLLEPLIEWHKSFSSTKSGWEWRKESIDHIETLFGKPLAQVLTEFQASHRLSELSGVGKTLARAADLTLKTGKVPYELR